MLDALGGAYEQRVDLVRELFDELLSETEMERDDVSDAVISYLTDNKWAKKGAV